MPEATEDVIERRVPGIPEAIRAYEYDHYQEGNAQPGHSRDTQADTDH